VERSRKFALAAGLLVGVIVLGRFMDLEDPGRAPEDPPATPTVSAPEGKAIEPESELPEPVSDPPVQDEPVAESTDPSTQVLDYEYRGVPVPMSSSEPVEPLNEWERAFQKEERDEAWARPLEEEIRTSLEPGVSLGHFHVANIECRATLCEIRLLARGSLQGAELDRYQEEIFKLPWATRLTPALSSGVSSQDSYESIWIFEKKAETTQAR
jgi:hypothetical protein